jgi:hypothetical protein
MSDVEAPPIGRVARRRVDAVPDPIEPRLCNGTRPDLFPVGAGPDSARRRRPLDSRADVKARVEK